MRSRRCLARWMLTAAASGSVLSAPALSQEVHAIENARVWVGDGAVQEAVHLVLRDGLIEALGPDVGIPSDAVRTDAAGMTVYPGWMDAYSNLGVTVPEPSEDAAPGNEGVEPDFTQESQPQTREANRRAIHPERRARDFLKLPEKESGDLREAGFTHLLVALPDGILRGQSCVTDLSGAPPRRSVIGESGLLHAHLRARHRGGYPGTLMANLAHVRQTLHDARRLRAWQELERRRPRGTPRSPDDSALESLFNAFDGEQRVAFEADSENDILRALSMAREFRLHPVIVGGREAWRVAGRLAAERVPVIACLDFPDEPEREGAKKSKAEAQEPEEPGGEEPAGTPGGEEPAGEWAIKDPVNAEPLKLFAERRARWLEKVRNVAVLMEAGVEVALSTSGSTPGEFVKDLALACEHGLNADAALAALTVVPARLTGVDARLGLVQTGMTANLILVEGEPIGEDRVVRYTFVAGQRFAAEQKEEKKDAGDGGAAGDGSALVGTWSVTAGDEGREFTLVVKPDGEDLGGQLKSEMGAWDIAKAGFDGDEFHIVVNVEFNTQSFEFVLKGTVEGDRIRGTLETPFGEPSPFEGKRTGEPGEVR